VYQPNQVNASSAQLKPANNFRLETRPVPDVYRPKQSATVGVQLMKEKTVTTKGSFAAAPGPASFPAHRPPVEFTAALALALPAMATGPGMRSPLPQAPMRGTVPPPVCPAQATKPLTQGPQPRAVSPKTASPTMKAARNSIIQQKIFINGMEQTINKVEDLINLFHERTDLVRQIVTAWHESGLEHDFEDQEGFEEAVRENRKTLQQSQMVEELFTKANYLFSTKEKGRKETMYFKDRYTGTTGRIRQQHRSGPLARIDKQAKVHRFIKIKQHFRELEDWEEKNPGMLPKFYPDEKDPEEGHRHVEFVLKSGKKISGWHASGGRVIIHSSSLKHRIRKGLRRVIGMSRKIKK
jgi:hypothetical protein